MTAPVQFPYLPRPNGTGPHDTAPLLPARLSFNSAAVDVEFLVDSGAVTNVVPYDVGARFGLSWQRLPKSLTVGGAGGSAPAKALPLNITIGSLPPTTLFFAWVITNTYPLVLGQVDFFQHFDVCFFRSRGVFQIQPRTP